MKTTYETLTDKIEIIEGAIQRCMARKNYIMAALWKLKRDGLIEKRDSLSVGEAEAIQS